MSAKLDLKDMKILYELDKDCRQSYTEIGQKVGLPKRVVGYRIAKLESEGVITGYITQTNINKLGLLMYNVLLKLQNVNLEEEKELIAALNRHPDVHWLVTCFGQWEVAFAFTAKTVTEFYNKISETLKSYNDKISHKEFMLMMDAHFFTKSYLLKGKEKEAARFTGETEAPQIDDVEMKILRALNDDAKISLADLAAKCSLTTDAARNRLKRLVRDGTIQSFRALIDKERIGYQCWHVPLKISEPTKQKETELMTYLRSMPFVTFASKFGGNYNAGFDVDVRSIEEITKVLTELRYHFPDLVQAYEPLLFIKEHKPSYYRFPPAAAERVKNSRKTPKRRRRLPEAF